MKCPHCLTEFHDNPYEMPIGIDADAGWVLIRQTCAGCKRYVLELRSGTPLLHPTNNQLRTIAGQIKSILVHPKGSSRPPAPPAVPRQFADDYAEACMVLPDSAKSAAALGRRCLQHILRTVAKVKPGNLADEIQQVMDSGKMPTHIVESIDAIRNIGNFAAHPLKSQQSGEIVDVETGEAEWTLDVLEALFDFYFVQPEVLKKKRDALNAKLQGAGKPPMK